MNGLSFCLTLLLVGAAINLGFAPWPSPRARFSGYWMSIAGCAGGFVWTLWLLPTGGEETAVFHWMPGLALSFGLDSLTLFFLAPVFLLGGLALLYSTEYFHGKRPVPEMLNAGILPLVVVCMAGLLMARDMVGLALLWEAMALGTFFLVMHEYDSADTQQAGYIYLVYSQAGALCLLAAFGIWASSAKSFALDGAGLDMGTRSLIFFLALAAFGSKAGLAPLHTWLPYAHPAAPSHVSAFMSGALIKMGVYGVLRFHLVLGPVPHAGEALFTLGGATALMGILYALGQADMKRALAYSSVENIGVIFLSVGLGMIAIEQGLPRVAVFAFTGALLHVWNHALFKSLLFFSAGAVYHVTGTRRIDQMGGLLKSMPAIGPLFLIGALAIAGLPPLNGFAGEFMIYMAGFHGARVGGIWFLPFTIGLVILAVSGGLAAACFTRLFGIAFLGRPRSGLKSGECGPTMRMTMIIPAALCVILGVAPSIALPAASPAVWALVHSPLEDPSLGWTMSVAGRISVGALAIAIVFAVFYALRRMIGGGVEEAPTWGCGFPNPSARLQYTGASFAAPILKFQAVTAPMAESGGEVEGLFPNAVRRQSVMIDLAEKALGAFVTRPVEGLLDRLRWIQHGRTQLYIAYILVALVVLLLAM